MLNYKDKNYFCQLDLGLEFIRGKWKGLIICHLKNEPVRFLELQRRTKGITQKILNEQLKALEEEGIVERIVYPEVPPRVEYKLTQKGLALLPALEMIEKWAENYLDSCDIGD
ncbi:MAG: winged helix-turn-helix transcriptional regulator [Cetobacterium sp.]|uniref:winged helix-turn-helix transcriptional regulator n=1 Tax=unclassified Cetobacterium TaxID=2630983 RepID=UPI0006466ED6|nr:MULTISPECIES: helix-turn-helix domain-containing protein [unclassified Cetobacterium]